MGQGISEVLTFAVAVAISPMPIIAVIFVVLAMGLAGVLRLVDPPPRQLRRPVAEGGRN